MPCTRRFTIGKHTEFTRALVFHLAVPCLPCYRPTLRYHASPHRCMGYFYFYYCFTMCSQLHHVELSFFFIISHLSLFPLIGLKSEYPWIIHFIAFYFQIESIMINLDLTYKLMLLVSKVLTTPIE